MGNLKETKNNIYLTGVLVDHNLKAETVSFTNRDTQQVVNREQIKGSIIVRTKDGSEIDIDYMAKRYKDDGTESQMYTTLSNLATTLKTIKTDRELADVVRIGSGKFGIQDYISKKDGRLVSFNNKKANFLNILSQTEIEAAEQEGKFEIEGVVASIENEMKRENGIDVPTGGKEVVINIIGYQGMIIPVKVIVPTELVPGFMSSGYSQGVVATLFGEIVNTVEIKEETVNVGFGMPQKKISKIPTRKLVVTGGSIPTSMVAAEIDINEYNQALGQRQIKLDSLKNKPNNTQGFPTPTQHGFGSQQQSNTQTPNVGMGFVPPATQTENPFAKQQ